MYDRRPIWKPNICVRISWNNTKKRNTKLSIWENCYVAIVIYGLYKTKNIKILVFHFSHVFLLFIFFSCFIFLFYLFDFHVSTISFHFSFFGCTSFNYVCFSIFGIVVSQDIYYFFFLLGRNVYVCAYM